jgi:hypothetical protein
MITPPEVFKSLADETRARATLLIANQGELCLRADVRPGRQPAEDQPPSRATAQQRSATRSTSGAVG